MLELEEALDTVLKDIRPLGSEYTPLDHAVHRILSDDVTATIDLPSFDNSAMDGYAVRSKDLASASASQPVTLRLTSRIPAGTIMDKPLSDGECARIYTGSAVPPGADAVVMQEDTRTSPEGEDLVEVLDTVKPWENIRLKGEDVKHGNALLKSGSVIGIPEVALMGAMGMPSVPVTKCPTVGVLATGSELLEAGEALMPGKIYESNRQMLANLIREAGGMPRVYPLVKDTLEDTREALGLAFSECDTVVSSGGVSVGDLDFVKEAFEAVGGKLDFWKIRMKPGKPFVFGLFQAKPWFGLPGNPVSALVTFILMVRPALRRMQGAAQLALPTTVCTLDETLTNRGNRPHYVRMIIGNDGRTHSTGIQASHMLSTLASANGLLRVPAESEIKKGETVSVMRMRE